MVQKAEKIWKDGRLIPWDEANVHVLTHTLHYGLGVFEGIRCYECADGRSAVFRLREHVVRLLNSAKIGEMEIPFTVEEIEQGIKDTLKANNLKEGYIRPIAIIGEGVMGVHPQDNPIELFIVTWPWGAYLGEEGLRKGIRVKISSFTRHHVNISMTKAKICGNYVNSILAKREAVRSGYDEALLLDTEGYVCEASGENIFIVEGNTLKTPPLTSILPGITRDSIMTLAKDLGLDVVEQRFTRDELYTADEAFFCGTAAEVTPIREVDDRTIGKGSAGDITLRIQAAYFDVVKGKDEWAEGKYTHWRAYIDE
ncbi:MAG: branched-chain amino acid transaminase [Deltaproteobacteria bacterium]|nr:branched-chain amino acid transaminase [Deltaproteobacteria bacterium]